MGKTMKTKHSVNNFGVATPSFEDVDHIDVAPSAVRVRIPGLRSIAGDIYEIDDVKVGEIDWQRLGEALGREFVPDGLAAAIDCAVFQYTVAEILSERIIRR